MAQNTANFALLITAGVKGINQVNRLGNSMQGAQGKAKNLAMSVKRLVGPLALIASSVATFRLLGSSLDVLATRTSDLKVLATGLSRLTRESGKTARELQSVADELGLATLFDEQEFVKGFNLLTSFKNIGVDSYSRVAETAADLAQLNQVDLKSSFMQLAKALSDPTRGLTALSRSGVLFTDAQKEMILSLKESGKEMEAQAMILKVVEESYQGTARAAASGLAGALDTMGQKFRDFQAELARLLEPVLKPLVEAMTRFIENMTKGLQSIISNMPQVIQGFKTLLQITNAWAGVMMGIVTTKFFVVLLANLKKIVAITKLLFSLEKAKTVLLKTQAALQAAMAFAAKGGWAGALLGIGAGGGTLVALNELTKQITANLEEMFKDLDEKFNIDGVFNPENLSNDVKSVIQTIKGQLKDFYDEINNMGEQIGNSITSSFKKLEDVLVDFVRKGKLDFSSLVNHILDEMARIAVRQTFIKPLLGAFQKALSSSLGDTKYIDPLSDEFAEVYPVGAGKANGGMVSSPQRVLLGESEPELVIPQSKMDSAMRRYAKGARGESILEGGDSLGSESGNLVGAGAIDVRFDVQRINAVDYVTAQQFEQGIRSATEQGARKGEQMTLRRLQTSPNTRKRIGV